jgi:hypothetical protein
MLDVLRAEFAVLQEIYSSVVVAVPVVESTQPHDFVTSSAVADADI